MDRNSAVDRLQPLMSNKPQVPIKANKNAQHFVTNGINATMNREFTREVNKKLKEKLQELMSGQSLLTLAQLLTH